MTIRHTTAADLDAVMRIYAEARVFMRANGNETQWPGDYPPREYIEGDIERGVSYVCEKDGEVVATFYYNVERDATYERIKGNWLDGSGAFAESYDAAAAAHDRELCAAFDSGATSDASYAPVGVCHRLARTTARTDAKGVGAACIEWCFEQCGSLKIDTHVDNAPMRVLLDKLGFTYCGIIWVLDGEERIAFQKTK